MTLSADDFEQNMDAIEAFLALDDVDSVGTCVRHSNNIPLHPSL